MEPARKGGEEAGLKKGQGASDMDEDFLDCPVCLTPYDECHLRPRTLPCGHTLCTICINGLVHHNEILCPVCCVTHTVPEAGNFAITYVIENLIRSRREAGLSSPAPTTPEKGMTQPAHSPAAGLDTKSEADLSKATRSLLQERVDKVLAAIGSCQEVEEQLNHYEATLVDWSGRQQALHDRLLALVEQNSNARMLVQQEKDKVAAKRQQIHKGKQQLQDVLQTLHTTTRQGALDAIEDAQHHTDEERLRREECREVFPDVNTVTTVNKAMAATEAAVKAAETVQCVPAAAAGDCSVPAAAAGDCNVPADPTSTITERFKFLLTPPLEAKDIRTVTQAARRLLEAGLVFTTHSCQGVRLHGRVTLDNGRPCLHCLQDKTVPFNASILKMDQLVPATPPCMVFMDLAWPDTPPRRVTIRLSPDTPRGRQFVLMVTGQRGPSYLNTSMWRVLYKGQPGEGVVGGRYNTRDGRTVYTALLTNLDNGEYRRSRRAGAVSWRDSTVFTIITRDWTDGLAVSRVFGDVVDGLEVLQAAANQHTDNTINKVTVVDCGVVVVV